MVGCGVADVFHAVYDACIVTTWVAGRPLMGMVEAV